MALNWSEIKKQAKNWFVSEDRSESPQGTALALAMLMNEAVKDMGDGVKVSGMIASGLLVNDIDGGMGIIGDVNFHDRGVWSGPDYRDFKEAGVNSRLGEVMVEGKVYEIQNPTDKKHLTLLPEKDLNLDGVAFLPFDHGMLGKIYGEEIKREFMKYENLQTMTLAVSVLVWAKELGEGSSNVKTSNGLEKIKTGLLNNLPVKVVLDK